jgi:hypothetical protein
MHLINNYVLDGCAKKEAPKKVHYLGRDRKENFFHKTFKEMLHVKRICQQASVAQSFTTIYYAEMMFWKFLSKIGLCCFYFGLLTKAQGGNCLVHSIHKYLFAGINKKELDSNANTVLSSLG